MNLIYRLLIENSYSQYDFKIERAIDIMEEYGLFSDGSNMPDSYVMRAIDTVLAFKQIEGEKIMYNIFFGNLHIKAKKVGTDIIYSIFIKKEEDSWNIKDRDFSHPLNETYRVYIWYDISVLDITRAKSSVYLHGNWDKYVYNSFRKFTELVDNCTDRAKFNIEYKK